MNTRGFTLIELLLVIVIVAMAAAIAAPQIGSGNQTAKLNSAVRDVSSAFRFARGQALTHHKEISVIFNLQNNSYQITDKNKLFYLASAIEITLNVAQSQIISEDEGGVRFFSDGSSTGGQIILEIEQDKRQIDINWLTGQVTLGDA